MTRLRSSRKATRRKLVIVLLLLVALALIVADSNGALARQGRTLSAYLFRPAQSLSQDAVLAISDQASNLSGSPRTDDPADLFQALSAQQAAEIADLKRQLAGMKEIARGLSHYSLSLIPARIVSRAYIPPGSGANIDLGTRQNERLAKGHLVLYDYISAGKSSGLKRGQPVVDVYGIIGVVDQAGSTVSQIKLVTCPDCHLAARLIHWEPKSACWIVCPVVGITEGAEDGQSIRLQRIPQTVEVAPGDYVVTVSTELPSDAKAANRSAAVSTQTGMPEHLIVGQVTEVATKPADLTHTILVRPRAELSKLDQVFVLSVFGSAAKP
jgi:cell shape-determining protein MreC